VRNIKNREDGKVRVHWVDLVGASLSCGRRAVCGRARRRNKHRGWNAKNDCTDNRDGPWGLTVNLTLKVVIGERGAKRRPGVAKKNSEKKEGAGGGRKQRGSVGRRN